MRGTLLDTLAPSHLPPNMLNRTLAAIDAGTQDEPPPRPPLSTFLAQHMAHKDWKRLPNGFRMRRIPGQEGSGRAWLFVAPPGLMRLPHRHVGDEWTVILSGVFHDGDRAYQVGDFGHREDGEEHQPFIGAEGRCVSLIMVRESPKYTTTVGRLAAPFVRL